MKARIILIIAILCAVAQGGWASPTIFMGVEIYGLTNGSQYKYSISSTVGGIHTYGPFDGTKKTFRSNYTDSNFTFSNGVSMTLNGDIEFANASGGTDVTATDGSFNLVFTSTHYYFAGFNVTTVANETVEGCTVSGMYTKTLTISIPKDASFSKINIVMATNTPLNYCTLSGLDEDYVDYDGIRPEPIVTLEGQTLRKDVDYTLSYNYGSTTATVTVTGTGEYIGSNSYRYNIHAPALTDLHSLGTNIYEIASQQDLDFLARIVKGKLGTAGNNCDGLTFRQTADIAYSYTYAWDVSSEENNFTPIGGYGYSFQGIFDGQGHTISGIRIYKDDTNRVGLFGYLGSDGTVKNVILSDANITGANFVCGLVGYNSGTITDCYLVNVYVTRTLPTGNMPKITASQQDGGTCTRTHFRNCIRRFPDTSSNNHKIIEHLTDIYALNLGPHVGVTRTGGTTVSASMSTYDDGITINDTQYYTPDATVTLEGLPVANSGTTRSRYVVNYNDGVAHADRYEVDSNGKATFVMPAAEVAVGSERYPCVAYIDGNGTIKYCTDFTFIESGNENVRLGAQFEENWYVVNGNVTINGRLQFLNADSHLILCDGASLTVSVSDIEAIIADDGAGVGNLTIYGQAESSGTVTATSIRNQTDACGIDAWGAITINGGIISAEGFLGGINTIGTITINRGTVTGTSYSKSFAAQEIHINGGVVNGIITSNDPKALGFSGRVYLAWSSPTDRVYADKYRSTVSIKSGQAFWNGSEVLSGTITDLEKVNGKTLTPYIINAEETTQNLTANQATFAGQAHYWTTFYHPNWNYTLPTSTQAFYMKDDHALYRVGDGSIIPAGCAVVIMADSASIELTATSAPAPSVTGNILQGTSTATTAPAGAHVMSQVGTTFGFFEYAGTDPIPANKAYYVQ